MASTSEQGHNRNAANFDKLITHCVSYGTAYNPSKGSLKIAALQAQATAARNCLTAINTLTPSYKNAVAARVVAYKPLDKLVTRLGNALKASDTTTEVNDAAKTIIRKLQGRRATPKKTDEEKKTAADAGNEITKISTSQLSYDNRLDNLDKLIKMLASIPQYAPNEAELKTAALTTLYNDLKAKNTAVTTAEIPLNNARITRNNLLYKEETGLVDTATTIKTYIKSIYNASSPQYKAISKLTFVKVIS